MDYPTPSLVILVSVVLVLSCGETDSITDVAKRLTHVTIVGVSNEFLYNTDTGKYCETDMFLSSLFAISHTVSNANMQTYQVYEHITPWKSGKLILDPDPFWIRISPKIISIILRRRSIIPQNFGSNPSITF